MMVRLDENVRIERAQEKFREHSLKTFTSSVTSSNHGIFTKMIYL